MARADETAGRKVRTVQRVRKSDVLGDDGKDAVLRLVEHEEGQKADSTIRAHAQYLHKFRERSDTPLLEQTNRGLTDVLDAMRSGSHPDVKDSGIQLNGYQSALRVFYRFHTDHEVDPDEIEIEQGSSRNLTPDDLLYRDEVDDLLNAARRTSVRDMAVIALMLATGQRLEAVRTLRLRHVESDGPTMQITLNEDEGALKGASGTKPLLWAKHYVRPWVESHPFTDDPDAALFCTVNHGAGRGQGPEAPISDDAIRRLLRDRAKEAGIQKDVYPHLLRHTAITRMVSEGLGEQQIKQIVGWAADSSQFETYVSLADELNNDAVRESLGLPTSDTGVPTIGRPTLARCPECNDQLPDDSERCPTCQTPLTNVEAEEGEPEERQPSAEELAEQFRRDPEKLEKVIEKLESS